ncbi:hypothetical protein [Streptomyces sp. PTD5-9]|uniref:hypothetical protein n=1 Tax=Streptomyces sp. PTD5-9 TaxID=3120150 RepID=UPI0030087FC5
MTDAVTSSAVFWVTSALKSRDLSPPKASAYQNIDDVDRVSANVRSQESELLWFEEHLVVLGVICLGQLGVCTGVRVSQRRIGIDGRLKDAEEQPVQVGDRLPCIGAALGSRRVEGSGLPVLEIQNPLADVIMSDLGTPIRH